MGMTGKRGWVKDRRSHYSPRPSVLEIVLLGLWIKVKIVWIPSNEKIPSDGSLGTTPMHGFLKEDCCPHDWKWP